MSEPIDYRTLYPAWFVIGLEPSYPEREDLNYKDDEADQQIGVGIADRMERFERDRDRPSGIDWHAHADGIQRLVEACRLIYHPIYKGWLSRNAPEGSRWRPHRTFKKNVAEDGGPEHDYAEWRNAGQEAWRSAYQMLGFPDIPPWGDVFELDHEKAIDPANGRRPSKDGIIQYGLGNFEDRPVGVAPMRPVYELAKRFYVDGLGLRAFLPVFPFTDDVADKRAERTFVTTHDAARAARIKRDEMSVAAKFLSLVLKEVDFYFGERQAGLVARAFYKRT